MAASELMLFASTKSMKLKRVSNYKLMNQIYREVPGVVSWLGAAPSDDNTVSFLKLLQQFATPSHLKGDDYSWM
jgi:hypothetical protein